MAKSSELNELLGQFIFKNESLIEEPDYSFEFLNHGINVYEVLRQENAIALFLEDHIRRLNFSSIGKGLEFNYDLRELKKKIKKLCKKNRQESGNIKIVLHSDNIISGELYIYPVPFDYPKPEDYIKGVKVISLEETRPDPNLKNWRPDFKSKILALKSSSSVYEVILINNNGIVTEGSQSNLFFISNNQIFTAKKEHVLPGITRDYIFKICIRENIKLTEIEYDLDLLYEAEAVFISGTSPKILPVSQVNNFHFSTKHKLLFKLMESYNNTIREYINSNQ